MSHTIESVHFQRLEEFFFGEEFIESFEKWAQPHVALFDDEALTGGEQKLEFMQVYTAFIELYESKLDAFVKEQGLDMGAFMEAAKAELLKGQGSDDCMSNLAARPARIDGHLHLWSDGADWAEGASPPAALQSVATIDRYVADAKAAGIDGAVIVHHHFPWTRADAALGIDHEYVRAALERHPAFFRAMGVADPRLGATAGCAALVRLKELGFSGVRFSGPLFAQVEGGLGGSIGRALFARAGELCMPVGVMAFGGVAAALPAIRALLDASTETRLIVDHFGFFRQQGEVQREAIDALLQLASCPRVFVKASAFMRVSASAYPAVDLAPVLRELLDAYGAERLLWGSDFPYALLGQPMPPGASSAPSGDRAGLVPYHAVASALVDWGETETASANANGGAASARESDLNFAGGVIPRLSDDELRWLLGGTALSLFWQSSASQAPARPKAA